MTMKSLNLTMIQYSEQSAEQAAHQHNDSASYNIGLVSVRQQHSGDTDEDDTTPGKYVAVLQDTFRDLEHNQSGKGLKRRK